MADDGCAGGCHCWRWFFGDELGSLADVFRAPRCSKHPRVSRKLHPQQPVSNKRVVFLSGCKPEWPLSSPGMANHGLTTRAKQFLLRDSDPGGIDSRPAAPLNNWRNWLRVMTLAAKSSTVESKASKGTKSGLNQKIVECQSPWTEIPSPLPKVQGRSLWIVHHHSRHSSKLQGHGI